MPIERRLDVSAKILWTTMRGGITMHDLRQHLDAVNELMGHRYCEIIDTRDAEPLFSARELPMLATHGRRMFSMRGMAPRAVVVGENDLMSFGLARMFGTLVAPWVSVRVFDNLPAAVDYIEATVAAREKGHG
jgi:hypothetical protein